MSGQGDEYLYVLLKRAAKELERLEELRLSGTRAALRPPHVPVLAALLEASPLTPGELAARCDIEPSTLTGLLRTLEKEGLVAREHLVRDERTYAVVLTARGRAASRVAVRTRDWAQTVVLRALPRDAAHLVAPLLGQVAAAAQSAQQAAREERARRSAAAKKARRAPK